MQKDIRYNGITQSLSDLDCTDGDLSLSHNIINENGAMRPIVFPDAEFTMQSGEILCFVHSTANYKNYIYLSGSNIKAFKIDSGARSDYDFIFSLDSGETLNKIESIGNTVVVLTDKRMVYFLFKENSYVSLGDTIPECEISFGLNTSTKLYSLQGDRGDRWGKFTINFDSISSGNLLNEFSDENKTKITSQVLAKVNKYIKEVATDEGKFLFPFFVRYALRMFDGSLIHHSAPILMIPCTKANPVVVWNRYTSSSYTSAELDIFGNPCTLDYRIVSDMSSLKNWGDIVKSIDVFVSEPLYTYDQNEQCTAFGKPDDLKSFMVGRWTSGDSENGNRDIMEIADNFYQKWNLLDLYAVTHGGKYPTNILLIPESETVGEKIREASNFYLLTSINISDYSETSDRTNIEVGEDYLANIVLKERMTDDYGSHDKLIPSYSFAYNSRLNIAGIKKELFKGYDSASIFPFTNGRIDYSASKDSSGNITESANDVSVSYLYPKPIYTYINEDREIVVLNASSLSFTDFGRYLFFPNTNASKMVVQYASVMTGNGPLISHYEVKLKEHTGLNGSFYFADFEEPAVLALPQTASADRTVYLPNKIYTSEVGNPFYFPLSGINTVGVGDILGISSTTKALSQGQFGQFPLLVFATDGIWAMEVSSTGLYSAKQPISRDVVSNPKSITQIDGAVVFISNRGVMVIDGSTVNPISSTLDGPSFIVESVEKLKEILINEELYGEIGEIDAVKDYLASCKISYDYPNSRLILFRDDRIYCYIYSIITGSWATASSTFEHLVNDYPKSYLQKANGEVVNISSKVDYDSSKTVKTFILSRPIKLDDDAYKTVNMIINRGKIDKSSGAVIVFASSDGFSYYPIGSAVGQQVSRLQGSPYRYFRIAIISTQNMSKALSTTSVYYTQKWRNKAR